MTSVVKRTKLNSKKGVMWDTLFMTLTFATSGTGLPGAGESQVVSEAKSSWWVKVNFIYFDSKSSSQMSKTAVEPVSCFMSHL